jgi:hypothetical protein
VQSLNPAVTALARFRYAVAANAVLVAGERFRRVLKAGFRPDEPRVPAGNPGGGQWTDEGGSAQASFVSKAGALAAKNRQRGLPAA